MRPLQSADEVPAAFPTVDRAPGCLTNPALWHDAKATVRAEKPGVEHPDLGRKRGPVSRSSTTKPP
jgi:hypothetical protein